MLVFYFSRKAFLGRRWKREGIEFFLLMDLEDMLLIKRNLFNNVWYTFIESTWLSCQHQIQPEYSNSALPYYGGIAAIRFGIIHCVENRSFLSFNHHGSTEVLKNDKMEEHIHYRIKLPTAVIMNHTFFNSKSLKIKYGILYSECVISNQTNSKIRIK